MPSKFARCVGTGTRKHPPKRKIEIYKQTGLAGNSVNQNFVTFRELLHCSWNQDSRNKSDPLKDQSLTPRRTRSSLSVDLQSYPLPFKHRKDLQKGKKIEPINSVRIHWSRKRHDPVTELWEILFTIWLSHVCRSLWTNFIRNNPKLAFNSSSKRILQENKDNAMGKGTWKCE